MAALKGTKTEKNLMDAFAGESQARNKYTYFASVAKKAGYEKISAIFLETAENEKEHAKLHLRLLGGIGVTLDNLKAAAAGEGEEWTSMYPRMAAEARAEGFEDIARMFEEIATVEKVHQARYLALLKAVQEEKVFQRPAETAWRCRNCGYIHHGKEAPAVCPLCKHPRSYYEAVGSDI